MCVWAAFTSSVPARRQKYIGSSTSVYLERRTRPAGRVQVLKLNAEEQKTPRSLFLFFCFCFQFLFCFGYCFFVFVFRFRFQFLIFVSLFCFCFEFLLLLLLLASFLPMPSTRVFSLRCFSSSLSFETSDQPLAHIPGTTLPSPLQLCVPSFSSFCQVHRIFPQEKNPAWQDSNS